METQGQKNDKRDNKEEAYITEEYAKSLRGCLFSGLMCVVGVIGALLLIYFTR